MKSAPSNRNLILGFLAAIVLVVLLTAVLARRLLIFSPDDLVFQRESVYVLDADIADSLAVFSNEADVRAGVNGHLLVAAMDATLGGDVRETLTVFAKNISFEGSVGGDTLLVGGNVRINGEVNGEVMVFAESLTIDSDNLGRITACVEMLEAPTDLTVQPCDRAAANTLLNRAGTRLAGVWVAARLGGGPTFANFGPAIPLPPGLMLAGLGALAVIAFPHHINRITLAALANPRRMGLVGALVVLMMIGLGAAQLVVLSVSTLGGFVLLPFLMLVAVAFWVLFLAGWSVTALLLGRWIAARVTDSMIPPLVLTALGGITLVLLALLLHLVPVVGKVLAPVAILGVGIVGLGASYTTHLGTRNVAL
jgi:hypothetical protein